MLSDDEREKVWVMGWESTHATFPACPPFGHRCEHAFTVPDKIMLKLADRYERIAIWLDKDKRSRCVGYLHRYRSLGINTRLIFSERDPKFYTNDEIGRFLK